MVRCFVAPCSLAKVTTRFMESLHFFQKKFGLSPGGKSFSPGEFFFLYFPVEIFEFSFNSWCKIGCSPGHLNRVYITQAQIFKKINWINKMMRKINKNNAMKMDMENAGS